MWTSLAVAGVIYNFAVVFFGITALLAAWLGNWALLWGVGIFAVGTGFHVWWCVGNGINPLTAEPKDRYYRLRG